MKTNKKIAYCGSVGAYSHQVCLEHFSSFDPVGYPSYASALRSVENGQSNYVLIPLENSYAGRIAAIHNVLPKTPLKIVGEVFNQTVHHLYIKPSVPLKNIKRVRGHVQTLEECREQLSELGLDDWEVFIDSATAAKITAQNDRSDIAVVASPMIGDLYDLQCVNNHLNAGHDFVTRYIVMAMKEEIPDCQGCAIMTSVIFTTRSIPAALYKALGGFATNGVNITKLESYYGQFDDDMVQFYADIQGDFDDENVRRAFNELGYFADVKILGTYPASEYRKLT